MSTSIRICSYLLLPLIYLLVNVKIAQLGESFPITIVTFLPVLLLLFLERISVKKLMIALGIGAGLTAFNYLFGQSLDASKYVTSTMLFVYIVIIIGMVWSIRFKTISPHNHRKILRFFYLVVGLVVALAAVEMAQIILTGGSSIMESISKYLIYSNSYVLNFIKFGGKRTTALYFEPAFFALALISIWRVEFYSNVDIRPEFELSTSDMIVQFALRNLGVGCVVKNFAQEYLDSGVLFELRFKSLIPKRDICVITDETRPLSIAASRLLELIRQ